MMVLRFLLIIMGLIIAPIPAFSTINWMTDYTKALEKAEAEEKPLLLYFTGSDWSGLGMKMKNEVLDSKVFQEKIASHFICVEIDFPQHKSLSAEKTAQNMKLKEHFQINEYPLLILIDPQNREIVRLGYLPTSGEVFANDLLRIIQQDRNLREGMDNLSNVNRTELFKLYHLAQELQRVDAIHSILKEGIKSNDPFFLLEKYRLLVEEGKMTSSEGLSIRDKLLTSEVAQTHFRVATIEFQELAKNASETKDLHEVIKPLKDYLTRFGKEDPENVWRIEMMIAQFYLESDEWRIALKHAETAFQAAPQDMRSTIEHSLNYIRDQADLIVQK